MSVWRFRLLGRMEIIVGGRPVASPPYRTQPLMAALLLHPGPQRRESLLGLLFPDLPEATGRRRLSDHLYLLRRHLAGLPVTSTSGEIHLPIAERWLDVEDFRELAVSEALPDWQRALNLYRDDLLPTCFDDWVLLARERLRLSYVQLLERTCRRLLEQGQPKLALPLAQHLLEEEPFDEGSVRLLMQTYTALGQRGAALRAYEDYAVLVRRELDAEPEAATQALAQAVRATGPALSPALPAPARLADASPQGLVRAAQTALHRGDWTTLERALELMRRHSAADQLSIDLLEVDMAMLAGEYERATALLGEPSNEKPSPAVLARGAALHLAHRQHAEARDVASQALLLAHEQKDDAAALEALLVLAPAQSWLGEPAQVDVTLSRAFRLATSLDSPSSLARAHIASGRILFRQGSYADASASFYEAQSVAHAHGLRPHLATALLGIANARSHMGRLTEALPLIQQALSIRRDLGLRRKEALTLQLLAATYDSLGRHFEAAQANENAHRIYQELGDAMGVACSQYHLAASLSYQDDSLAPQAAELAGEALDVFRGHGWHGWAASALGAQGYALWVAGEHAAALDALQEAYALHEQLNEVGFLPELQAYQGLAHLGLGQHAEALACTRRALMALAQGMIDSEIISEVYYAHAAVLAAQGREEEAHDYFVRSYENLLTYAAQLQDDEARRAFFQRDPTIRRLMAEVYARGIAPDPDQGVVTRRVPTRAGRRTVPARWTLDAGPPDEALRWARGAIALRRARLARILRESEAQGVSPTVCQLADLLGVSTRTIKRDLAALRQE